MNTNKLGIKGEKAAAKYLKKNKYKIIYTNYETKFGEIDIIAENNDYIVFVEVKTRTEGQILPPSVNVDYKKRRKILITSSSYMRKFKTEKQPRYDIAEVIVNHRGKASINYIENAFWQEDDYAVF